MFGGTQPLDDLTKQSEMRCQLWAAYFWTNKGQEINFYFVSATRFWDCFVGAF